jgi:hypothetical protein
VLTKPVDPFDLCDTLSRLMIRAGASSSRPTHRAAVSDIEKIATVVLETPGLCADCIAARAGVTTAAVRGAFGPLARTVRIAVHERVCADCSKQAPVLALAPLPFVLGDIVMSDERPGWSGHVVGVSRVRNGYVTVRWRTASGASLQAQEERMSRLRLVTPISGGSAFRVDHDALLALHRRGATTIERSRDLASRARTLHAEARFQIDRARRRHARVWGLARTPRLGKATMLASAGD